jgi:antitoxin (DNA-binding transcriptional repressor) of toxin-antitoxin stability system
MRTDISATDAVRHFSELLNNIRFRGVRYTIIRGGKPAAALVPLDDSGPLRRLGDLNGIFQTLPHIDPEDITFVDDVLEVIEGQPPLPGYTSWE